MGRGETCPLKIPVLIGKATPQLGTILSPRQRDNLGKGVRKESSLDRLDRLDRQHKLAWEGQGTVGKTMTDQSLLPPSLLYHYRVMHSTNSLILPFQLELSTMNYDTFMDLFRSNRCLTIPPLPPRRLLLFSTNKQCFP